MNSRDLETEFKNEDHPFRLVIVCAMWITGFDVPSLSTMYIDKPLKSLTLMQTIARANRIDEGKNNGLIVDYIETYKALLDALAIYGTGPSGEGENDGEIEPPVRPKEELITELEQSLESIETFLKEEVSFDLNELVEARDLKKIATLEKGLNAVYTNDETKIKFQILAREVFKKFRALMPDKILNDYSARKNKVDAIYRAIEDNIESADVTAIMKKIQDVVDASIESMVKDSPRDSGKITDISGINIDLLEKEFQKIKNKNSAVQFLKDKIEKQLKYMVENNPLRVDFYTRYQEIIDEYNKGKDVQTIEESFRKLMEQVKSLTEEQVRVIVEELSEEQAAIFDIIRKPTLTKSEKEKVKSIAISLLEELKKEKLRVQHWSEKAQTAAAVYNFVNNTLFSSMPESYQLN